MFTQISMDVNLHLFNTFVLIMNTNQSRESYISLDSHIQKTNSLPQMCGPHAAEKGKLKNVESVFEDSLLTPTLLGWIINSRWEGIWKFHEGT